MELTVIVVDKYGNELSDKELKNKVIDIQAYYDLVLPIRKRINDELFREGKKATIQVERIFHLCYNEHALKYAHYYFFHGGML